MQSIMKIDNVSGTYTIFGIIKKKTLVPEEVF